MCSKEHVQGLSLAATLLAGAKVGTFLRVSRQTIRLWYIHTTDYCKATGKNELNQIKYTDN